MFGFSPNPLLIWLRQAAARAALLIAFFMLCASVGWAEWGGGISAAAVDTRSDSSTSMTVDQNYDLHVSDHPLPQLQYVAALRYRILQTNPEHAPYVRQREVQPTLSVTWSHPYYTVRSNYLYREQKDNQGAIDFTGQSVGAFAQTNVSNFPRLQGRYEWTRNINDLDLVGSDTRLRTYSLGSIYNAKQTSVSYNYVNNLIRNPSTGLERTDQRHVGRFNNTLQVFRKFASIQTSYHVVDRSEREVQAANQEPLLPVEAITGLYLEDPSPELGTLESLPALIDGVTTAPVSPEIDLSGAEFHNFGLDFGAAVDIEYLFLSTDTLAYPDLRWAVYVSDDNLNWRLVKAYERAFFSTVFNRYEVSFTRQTVRYIKLVLEPLQQTSPVRPTELRALTTRAGQDEPDHFIDHRGNIELRVRPAEWLQASVGADIVRTEGGLSSLRREQDGVRGSFRASAATWAVFSGNVQASRTRYPETTRELTEGQLASIAVESQWLRTLTTRAVFSRTEERVERVQTRLSSASNFRAQMQWLPGLAGISEIGYIEDSRPASGDVFFTKVYGQSVEALPLPSVTVIADYRYYDLDARIAPVPSFRETIQLRLLWRLTNTIFLSGDRDAFREPDRQTYSDNLQASWNPTPKWTLGSGWSRAGADENAESTLFSVSAMYRWTTRTDFSFAYYHSHYDEATQPGISSARLGFNTRF